MSLRAAAETKEQRERADAARTELRDALDVLADEAKRASARLRGKQSKPVDLSPVVGAFRTFQRNEDAYDITLSDIEEAGADL